MRTLHFRRLAGAAMILALVGAVSACAAEPGGSAEEPPAQAPSAAPSAAPQTDPGSSPASSEGGDGEYAFGTDRDEIAYSIEQAFSSQNGTARWEGDTLVLSVDGDADSPLAGFTECRVLDELLLDDDASVIEMPNGSVDCAELLGQ